MAEQKKQDNLRAAMKYQDAASYLLMNSCPTVSRFLQQEITDSAMKYRIDMPISRKHQVCGACGNLAITSSSFAKERKGKVSDKKRGGRKNTTPKHGTEESKPIITKCGACGIQSKSWIAKRPRISIHTRSVKTNTTLFASLDTKKGTKRTSRSKTQSLRKKGNSLQAMLANSKKTATATSSSFGLSLMDLMKTGSG